MAVGFLHTSYTTHTACAQLGLLLLLCGACLHMCQALVRYAADCTQGGKRRSRNTGNLSCSRPVVASGGPSRVDLPGSALALEPGVGGGGDGGVRCVGQVVVAPPGRLGHLLGKACSP